MSCQPDINALCARVYVCDVYFIDLIRDSDACENQGRHVRRTHYSSGACLFVKAAAFHRAGGFAEELYEAYYEDTHLQMHLRHRQHLHVLYRYTLSCVMELCLYICLASLMRARFPEHLF